MILAAICEHNCTLGDGFVVLSLCGGIVGALWAMSKFD